MMTAINWLQSFAFCCGSRVFVRRKCMKGNESIHRMNGCVFVVPYSGILYFVVDRK